jgi:hypothetical protein
MRIPIALITASLGLFAPLATWAQMPLEEPDRPAGQVFEAEAYALPKTKELAYAVASGGKVVTGEVNWQQLVSIPLPEGDGFRVWVRHKGGPFAFKTATGDKWYWGKPQEWTWTNAGVFERTAFPNQKLVIQRNDGGIQNDTVQLDAVILRVEKVGTSVKLPPHKPDTTLPAQDIALSIDWNQKVGPIGSKLWAINENVILDNKDGANDPVFQKLLGDLNVSLLRIHGSSLSNVWTKAETRDWDVEKIKHAFAVSTGYGNSRIMLNIPRWPTWLSASRILEPEKEDEFAALCGRLARIMRDDVKRPIEYWEIINEYEMSYDKAGKMPDMWRLYNKMAAAIRKEDPNAKIGGPAFSWPGREWMRDFLLNCPDAQFLTWHNYGGGDNQQSNESLFGKVEKDLGPNGAAALSLIKQYAPGRKVETFLTETNVQYKWDPYEPRHQNQVGAIFMASVIHKLATVGNDGVMIWHQRTRPYGSLIGPGNQIFPAYHLYRWGNRYLIGEMVQNTSPNGEKLEVLAVKGENGNRAVLLLNKANHTLNLQSPKKLLTDIQYSEQLNAEGLTTKLNLDADKLSLPGLSLTLLTNEK